MSRGDGVPLAALAAALVVGAALAYLTGDDLVALAGALLCMMLAFFLFGRRR